ncbi:hypothetical protein H6G81_32325 [Scytonema hofmannii FACHB-248]|uniref:Uncharacterized protein n=1 Tax=Scytonema hofmannii FACHB-248 TaxID=1842502 RepID=A0ABR8H0L4_9CYAN|nr:MULTISPECIES: hypothetical protein [Nostocales]MBD2609079.1 hypothetical protein [Scytonema hofmannii FACHB-248]
MNRCPKPELCEKVRSLKFFLDFSKFHWYSLLNIYLFTSDRPLSHPEARSLLIGHWALGIGRWGMAIALSFIQTERCLSSRLRSHLHRGG